MVERPLMVRWVVGSIIYGGPIELSTTSETKAVICAIVSV